MIVRGFYPLHAWPEPCSSNPPFSRRLCAQLFRFRYPAAAHRLVQVGHRLELRLLCLRVLQLGIEQAALGVEHFNITGVAVVVAQPRGFRIEFQRLDLAPLRHELRPVRS